MLETCSCGVEEKTEDQDGLHGEQQQDSGISEEGKQLLFILSDALIFLFINIPGPQSVLLPRGVPEPLWVWSSGAAWHGSARDLFLHVST